MLNKKLDNGNYFIEPIPYYISQFASPNLVSEMLDKKMNPLNDPLWTKFGYKTIEEYEFWSHRLCGLICVKMILDIFSKQSKSENIALLTEKAISLGGYKVYDNDGKFIDKGWYYSPLINLSTEYGLDGEICENFGISDICTNVLKNKYSITSVNPKVIRGDIDTCENKGGHLVVIIGFSWDNEKCTGLFIHNPSGRIAETQAKAFIKISRFNESFAKRGFVLYKRENKFGEL